MKEISTLLCWIVAIEHAYFLVLEMFLWNQPRGRKTFGLTQEFADQTKALAANQGLYNGFLAAGLVFGLLHTNAEFAFQLKAFFLGCVLVAGIYGGFSVKRVIWIVQATPATLALAALWMTR